MEQEKKKELPNLKNESAETALIKADHFEIVRLLLNHNADVNLQDESGKTALMKAVDNNYTEIVRLLLKHNADVNLQDEDGETALTIAANKNYKIKTAKNYIDNIVKKM